MVPVVGVPAGFLSRGVAHHQEQFGLPRIRLVLHLHERNGVDAGIGVAPVGLETGEIGLDGLLQVPGRLEFLARRHRLLPAVLMDAAKEPVGLA